ncbi:adenylate cyclase type 10 [Discoglossus pictus]
MDTLPYIEKFSGVLLFADVSGFTALTEKFSMSSKKGYGADRLSRTLNKYIGEIVDHVLVFGGDVLKFAGDALLALWKVKRRDLSEVITMVVQCSQQIQIDCGVWETEIGVELRVKIGISAGRLSKIVVGRDNQEFFLVVGNAVDGVRLAEGLAGASDIILAPHAWELCDRNNIATEKIPNERAVKFQYIKWKTSFDIFAYIESYGSHLQHEPNVHETYRKASRVSPNENLEKTLRKYVTQTVLKKIDDNQPLDYLSEMRPVTILFLNLQFDESAEIEDKCQVIQDVYIGMSNLIDSYQGRINKIFMFDKGCTYLCVFGLPGDKQEDECTHALYSAFKIHRMCTQINKVCVASIGVTNGPAFCGVVGHPLRHEYTVIGRKVNLAARLMMHYPGLVSCDEVTYHGSKLPDYYFDKLPRKEMKGVQSPGTIYQYLGSKDKITIGKAHMTTERNENYPLLGRDKEIETFLCTLSLFLQNKKTAWKQCQRIIVYEGHQGYGKSQILAEINYIAQKEGHRVVALELNKINIRQQFYMIQELMAICLHIDVCKGFAEREECLQTRISGDVNLQNLCLLNNLFLVKVNSCAKRSPADKKTPLEFPITNEISLMDRDTRQREMETLLIRVLQQIADKESLVCIIDQAQFVDTTSWTFLSQLINSVPLFLVMGLCPLSPEQTHSSVISGILKSAHTVYFPLMALHHSVIPDIACHALGVVSIPSELEMLLVERSYGVPYYLEKLLRSLYLDKILVLEPMEEEAEEADGVDDLLMDLLNHRHPRKESRALCQLDCMTAAEQMVVKCAAVIGQKFSTALLRYILPKGSEHKLSQTLPSLVKEHILECAAKTEKQSITTLTYATPTQCYCSAWNENDRTSFLGYASDQWQCRLMRFSTPLLQETAYELWLQDQCKSLHFQCTSFLEPHAHKCSSCGGGEFIFFHRMIMNQEYVDTDLYSEQFETHESEITQTELNTTEGEEGQVKPSTSSGNDTLQNQYEKYSYSLAPLETTVDNHNWRSGSVVSSLKPYEIDKAPANKRFRTKVYPTDQIISAPLEPRQLELEFLKRLDWLPQRGAYMLSALGKSRKCVCDEILELVVSPLARHWMVLGDMSKTMYYLLETAAGALHINNNYMALSYINEAESLLEAVKKKRHWFRKSNFSRLETAYLYCMKGEAIRAYTDYFQCCQRVTKRKDCEHYAMQAMQNIVSLDLTVESLDATLYVSLALTYFKLCFGQLSDAVEFGFRTHAIADMVNKTAEEFQILPILFKALFLSNRYTEFVTTVKRMETLLVTHKTVQYEAWFYIVCLDILLEGGFAYCSLDDCLEFVAKFHSHSALATDNQKQLNFFSSLAIWYGRLQEWDKFYTFYWKAKKHLFQSSSSLFTLHGFSKLMECDVLLLHKAVEEETDDIVAIFEKNMEIMKEFKSCCHTAPVLLARAYHLKAYALLITGNNLEAQASLEEALTSAEKHGNKLEESWIKISNESWFEESITSSDTWLEVAFKMPLWEEAAKTDAEILTRRKFVLKPVNVSEKPGQCGSNV